MATGDNKITPLYRPGGDLTAAITAAVSAGTFIRPSASLQGGPLLDISTPTSPLTGGNLPQVATCGAGLRALGVAETDGATSGDVIPYFSGPGYVVPVTAGGTVTAGQEVESDATGRAITLASGKPNGLALSSATVGNPVYIRLY